MLKCNIPSFMDHNYKDITNMLTITKGMVVANAHKMNKKYDPISTYVKLVLEELQYRREVILNYCQYHKMTSKC